MIRTMMMMILSWTFSHVSSTWMEKNFIHIYGSLKVFADIFNQSSLFFWTLEQHLLIIKSMATMD